MLTEFLRCLDAPQRAKLDNYIAWWSQAWLATGQNDEDGVARALKTVYPRLGRKEPFVIWCQSPWQLAVTPFLLKLVCFTQRDPQRRSPGDTQRRIFRHAYRRDLQKMIRFELSLNLNEELWTKALDNLMAQLTPELELTLLHEGVDGATRQPISVERSLGLSLEKTVAEAHNDLRAAVSMNIIEDVMRELTTVSRPAMRARLALEQQLGSEIGRRFSDFNASLRGGFGAPPCPLAQQFTRQMGRDFSVLMGGLLFDDCGPPASERAAIHELFQKQWAYKSDPDARLTQVLTEYALTWATWSQDFFRVYLFPHHVLDSSPYRSAVHQEIEELTALRMGAFMYIFGEKVVFACKNPLAVRLNEHSELHSLSHPSLEFLDGYSLYSWQGVPVPKEFIDAPELLTWQRVQGEPNTELRRVMLDRYGTTKFLLDSGAQVFAVDECGSLFRQQLAGDEPLVMLRVVNSTAEPDGTFKEYFLRVPPGVKTPREAVAWTFGLKAEEYFPVIQT